MKTHGQPFYIHCQSLSALARKMARSCFLSAVMGIMKFFLCIKVTGTVIRTAIPRCVRLSAVHKIYGETSCSFLGYK